MLQYVQITSTVEVSSTFLCRKNALPVEYPYRAHSRDKSRAPLLLPTSHPLNSARIHISKMYRSVHQLFSDATYSDVLSAD